MPPSITPEQRKALDEHNGEPIVVIDPDRQQRSVLIADTHDRVRDLFAESNGESEWTAENEARRHDLIDNQHDHPPRRVELQGKVVRGKPQQ